LTRNEPQEKPATSALVIAFTSCAGWISRDYICSKNGVLNISNQLEHPKGKSVLDHICAPQQIYE
jgi:hypothetical protein